MGLRPWSIIEEEASNDILSHMIKRLYRSSEDKMIAGVCGGLAEYFQMDPAIVRILFFILLLPGGLPGLLPYIILWIVVPVAPKKHAK